MVLLHSNEVELSTTFTDAIKLLVEILDAASNVMGEDRTLQAVTWD